MAYNKSNNPIMRLGGELPVDPLTGMPVQTTLSPPRVSPIAGGFSENTQGTIQNLMGTSDMRQYAAGGTNAPLFFKDQTGDGKITRADVIKARTEGYKK